MYLSFKDALEDSNTTDLARQIAVADVFRDMANADIALLARNAWARCYRRGEMVFGRGERPGGVLIVAEGIVKLAVRGTNGDHKVIALIEENQVFACASALLDRPSALEASALTPATVVAVPAQAVLEAMSKDAGLARHLVEHVSQRVLSLIDDVEGVTLRRGLQRLAHYIQTLAREGDLPGGHAVRLPATKTVVAARLGIAKETLSRLLHELTEKGVISVVRRDLYILNRAALAELAAGRMPGNGSARIGAQVDARA